MKIKRFGEYLPVDINALVRAWEAQHEATIEEVKQI